MGSLPPHVTGLGGHSSLARPEAVCQAFLRFSAPAQPAAAAAAIAAAASPGARAHLSPGMDGGPDKWLQWSESKPVVRSLGTPALNP